MYTASGAQSLDYVHSIRSTKFRLCTQHQEHKVIPNNKRKNDIMGMEDTRAPKIAGQYQ